jgi:hypothetical protein
MAKDRAWVTATIERLMAPGVRVHPRNVDWLVKQRDRFYADPKARPEGIVDRLRRLLMQAGMIERGRQPRPRSAAAANYHPDASAPACLQGSRKPTPMAPWLVTGVGLPLRPPTRRQAVST